MQWYPVDTEGNQVGSGVYIGKGTIRTLGFMIENPDKTTTEIQSEVQQIYVKMGYVRR